MEPPETRFVNVGDADVAYQVIGEGSRDILFCNSLGGHVDLLWQLPPGATFLSEFSSLGRVLHMDRRGCGASDALPLGAIPTWEALAEDMTAVLDAVGSNLTDVVGVHEVGPIAVLFAAMHPDRVRSLILINTAARYLAADDYPIGVAPVAFEALMEMFAATWGTDENAKWQTQAGCMIVSSSGGWHARAVHRRPPKPLLLSFATFWAVWTCGLSSP